MLNLDSNAINLKKQKIVNDVIANKKETYILGRNENSKILSKAIKFKGFIDDFTQNETWLNKKIYKSNDIENKEAVIISCSLAIYPITAINTLKEQGFSNVVSYLDFVKYSNLDLNIKFLSEAKKDLDINFSKYETIYDLIQEEKSKKVFKDILNFRKNLDIEYMKRYKVDPIGQYFEDFLNFQEDEVFVDAGGFDGQTSIKFIEHCPKYRTIYIFEPDIDNLSLAKSNLKNLKNINFIQKGLSNKKKILKFNTNLGSVCSIVDNGNVNIEVDTLDNIINEKVTFIKMDIEGSERQAIKGMSKHIKNNFPKMAISVYHKVDDLWKIPEQIFAIRGKYDYDIFIRHYTEGTDETIMFFIPNSSL